MGKGRSEVLRGSALGVEEKVRSTVLSSATCVKQLSEFSMMRKVQKYISGYL